MRSIEPAEARLWTYLGVFVGTAFVIFVNLLLVIVVFQNKLPAPRFSIDRSFNEKIRWLAVHASTQCDILILGSSMGLNNIDGVYLERSLPGSVVVNAGSWGMSIADSDQMLATLLSRCRPKFVVFAFYYGDFTNNWNKSIDWNSVRKYLKGQHGSMRAYLENMDLVYYVTTTALLSNSAGQSNRKYNSLNFDRTGGVLFANSGFEIDPKRWDGYREMSLDSKGNVDERFLHFKEIQETVSKSGAKLVAVLTPLRPIAREALSAGDLAALSEYIRSVVKKSGNVFIDSNGLNLDDSNFTDFAHLNHGGAEKVTALVAAAIASENGRED